MTRSAAARVPFTHECCAGEAEADTLQGSMWLSRRGQGGLSGLCRTTLLARAWRSAAAAQADVCTLVSQLLHSFQA